MFYFRQIMLVSFFIFTSLNAFTQKTVGTRQTTKPPYNIKDYFLLIPDSLLTVYEGGITKEQRLKALKYRSIEELWKHNGFWIIDTLDYRNGYMKFSSTGDGAGSIFEITYFIKKDKTREIGVNHTYWDLESSFSILNFYTFRNNQWKNITNKVFPKITLLNFLNKAYSDIIRFHTTNIPVIYTLPQKGKTITAKIDIGTIDNLFDEKYIDEVEYVEIKKALQTILLRWNDGVFLIQ